MEDIQPTKARGATNLWNISQILYDVQKFWNIAKVLKYKAPFIPESEIVNNVPLSMALRNAENRIMAPKSNIIVGNVEEHFIFLHCIVAREPKKYIQIGKHDGMED